MNVESFNLFEPGAATMLALVAARVGGVVLVAPVFSATTTPVSVRTVLAVLLAVLLQPTALAAHVGIPALTPVLAVSEIVVGLIIGMGAAFIVGASEAAGEVIGIQIGLSGAAILDPLGNGEGSALRTFASLFTVALLLSLDLHVVMLRALAASFERLPVGAALRLDLGLGALVAAAARLFVLGVRFAAPVIAAVMLVNASLAVLGRVAPQVNLLAVAFPVQIMAGIVALGIALPYIAYWLGGWQGDYRAILDHAFRALATAPGR